MNSFIGSGCIWPDPDVEIRNFTFTGLAVEKPASFSNAFAASGS